MARSLTSEDSFTHSVQIQQAFHAPLVLDPLKSKNWNIAKLGTSSRRTSNHACWSWTSYYHLLFLFHSSSWNQVVLAQEYSISSILIHFFMFHIELANTIHYFVRSATNPTDHTEPIHQNTRNSLQDNAHHHILLDCNCSRHHLRPRYLSWKSARGRATNLAPNENSQR